MLPKIIAILYKGYEQFLQRISLRVGLFGKKSSKRFGILVSREAAITR